MITKDIDRGVIAWQQWGEETPGEPAIVLKKYSDSIELQQNDNLITISNHEVKEFIKILQKLNKND